MCGISFILETPSSEGIRERLLAMHARIPHRGPDGEGVRYIGADGRFASDDGGAIGGLAFRWLKIQDLDEEANQPFASRDGTILVLFNGEIYNFRALRDELEANGSSFHTRSDTEVIVAAYERWGTDCFQRFRGMWAIVIADSVNRRVVVSRDRFGIKPLYVHRDNRGLHLASEVKQLLAITTPRANRESLLHFLAGSRLPGRDCTFFEGIDAFPPGTYAVIPFDEPARLDPISYWALRPSSNKCDNLQEALERLRAVMNDTVALHMRAEVPVATFLSGGIDSSLITATAHNLGAGLPSFSMILEPEFARYDESRFIAATTSRLQLEGHAVTLTGATVHDAFARVAAVHEEPLGGMALIAQFLTYELAARNGARVILDGQGADEEFGGYPRQAYEYLAAQFVRMRGAAAAAAFVRRDRRELRHIPRAIASRVARAMRVRHYVPRFPWLALPTREIERLVTSERGALERARGGTALERMLYADTMSLNLYDVLGVGDRNSMAHSIESRVPFVDHIVAEFAFSLSDEMKIGNGWRKRILRELARESLPLEVVERTDKMGFAIPQAIWMRRHLENDLRTLHTRESIATSPLFHTQAIERVAQSFMNGHAADTFPLWRILAAATWAEAHGVTLQ